MGRIEADRTGDAGEARATVTDLRRWADDRAARRDGICAGVPGAPGGELSTGEFVARALVAPRRMRRARPAFSAGERTVLALLVVTFDDEELAGFLGLEPAVVRAHLARIHGKYAAAGRPARTRAHLAFRAAQDGFDETPLLVPVRG